MKKMSILEENILNSNPGFLSFFNNEEQTLNKARTLFSFIKSVIENDGSTLENRIFNIDFETGFGTAILANISRSIIYGNETNESCLEYAKHFFWRKNIQYMLKGLVTSADYVVFNKTVSATELSSMILKNSKLKRIFICEGKNLNLDQFSKDWNLESFKFNRDNQIEAGGGEFIIMSSKTLGFVNMNLPFDQVESHVEKSNTQPANEQFYDNPSSFLNAVDKEILKTEVAMDIGCGIHPMNYFRPSLHILIEPWKEYADIIQYRYKDDKSVLILNSDGLIIEKFADKSVDSIFLLDVIEHIEKETGKKILAQCERIARQQIIIFTPYGFMPQHVDHETKDAWGLSGNSVQEHISGWTPKDFDSEWKHFICLDYHREDYKKDKLDKPYGAFFAIKNIQADKNNFVKPETYSDLRRPLPSEIELEKTLTEVVSLRKVVSSLELEVIQFKKFKEMGLIKILRKIRYYIRRLTQ